MFKIRLTARAKRELKNLSKRHKESIGLFFEELKEDPFIGKPLARELTGRFSYRIGIYRVIYKIDRQNNVVYIITVGHRAMVYQ